MKKGSEDFFKNLGLTGTIAILEVLGEHKTARYMQFAEFVNAPLLNMRLRQLLESGLIEHHLERKDTKREWYTLTKKGQNVLNQLHKIQKILEK